MNTRIYNKSINIDNQKTKIFWEERANSNISLITVLLGDDKTGKTQEMRNLKEAQILSSMLNHEKLRILDIGCGTGRWINNLYDKIDKYVGIDYTKSLIDYARKQFCDLKYVSFLNSSIQDVDIHQIGTDYNLIICTGVLMYINNSDLENVFNLIQKISPKYFYIQESISLLESRMTLNTCN